MFHRFKHMFSSGKNTGSDMDDDGMSNYLTQEKILVFGISFVLAFCLWFIVNLSRDFNITVDLPLEVGNLPADQALVDGLPEYATVGVTGEGWQLIPLYNNPPSITVEVLEEEVPLFERVQQQLSTFSGVNVIKVQPFSLTLNLEQKTTRKLPVELRLDLELRDQYGIIGEPELSPDSVTVTGAVTKLEELERIQTEELELADIQSDRVILLDLIQPSGGIALSPDVVSYRIEVAEFTEGEVRIPIRIRNLPPGRVVTYNPSTLTVRYDVPIDQYQDVQNIRPFTAYIDFNTIQSDTTGLVIPEIERNDDDFIVRLRSFQPKTVSYFNVVDQNQ
ncbi:MAG: CdaR family protein [Balneolaceae bacterium]